jgi:hypothetical protein
VFASTANHHLPTFPAACHVRTVADSEMKFHLSKELGFEITQGCFPAQRN